MSTRSRAVPWWGGALEAARGRCSVHLDALELGGFVHASGPVLWVDPRWKPTAPPGDFGVCEECWRAFPPALLGHFVTTRLEDGQWVAAEASRRLCNGCRPGRPWPRYQYEEPDRPDSGPPGWIGSIA